MATMPATMRMRSNTGDIKSGAVAMSVNTIAPTSHVGRLAAPPPADLARSLACDLDLRSQS